MSTQQPTTWKPPRATSRYLLDQRLVLRAGAGLILHGRTKDISEGGLGATVAGELKTSEQVELEFRLPGSPAPLKLMAEVRYHLGFHYGFRFLHITDPERAQLRESARQLQQAP